jgi:hypothetical protein
MNPELEALIKALDAWQEAGRDEMQQREAIFLALVDEALERHPSLGRDQLLAVVRLQHKRWAMAQENKPTRLPPRA